jgi:hypothetical protein
MDIFKIRSLIASSLRWYDPRTGRIDQFGQRATIFFFVRLEDAGLVKALDQSARSQANE